MAPVQRLVGREISRGEKLTLFALSKDVVGAHVVHGAEIRRVDERRIHRRQSTIHSERSQMVDQIFEYIPELGVKKLE